MNKIEKNFQLDDKDREILRQLQNDASQPLKNIGKKVGMTEGGVRRRITMLKTQGVIKKYTVLIDPKKVDRGLTIYAVVKVLYPERYSSPKVMDEFGKNLAKIPEVQEVFTCSSDWDYLIKLKVKDTAHYHQISSNLILPLGGIEKLESVIIYGSYKDSPLIEL